MESRLHNQRSFPSQQLRDDSLEESSLLSRNRQPLTSSAGNAQQGLHHLDLSHHDNKVVTHSQEERPPPSYIVPSQPSRQSLNSLELRRQSIRRQRHNRFSSTHNPIVNSPQYQAYRNRQRQEGNDKDQKWPAVLEEAFLDALILIPQMGRRKFSMEGKPHGRNELISAYLWIAYKQTLAPGEIPDEDMRRARKQVSSHIQVLKGFLKGHPAGEKLFAKTKPANGFEDSFKNDPVLNALQAGRLYNPYTGDGPPRSENQVKTQQSSSTKPVTFWILITQPSKPGDNSRRYTREEDIFHSGTLVHKYTGLHTRSQQDKESLSDIPNWRENFPYLPQNVSTNELNYPIIHMDVSLVLMDAPIGSDLVTRMEMVVPGPIYGKHRWQAITTLSRPPELYYDNQGEDGPLNRSALIVETLEMDQNQTRIKVPFPANTWAHVLTRLMKIQNSYEESRKGGFPGSSRRARDYMDQIFMYQEVQSARMCTECSQGEAVNRIRSSRCTCPSQGFDTRVILLWTFSKARRGEQGSTTWRYIDPLPRRQTLMSPPPHTSHNISANMSEHFNSWAEPTNLQSQNIADPFGQGLTTPPHTAGLQSPFVAGYGYAPNNFDVTHQDMSFLSHAGTVDSEPAIIEHDNTPTIDSFLSSSAVGLGNYGQHSHTWNLPHSQSFESDPAWAYHVPSNASQVGWGHEGKGHSWQEASQSKGQSWHGSANPHLKHSWSSNGHGRNEHGHMWNSNLPIPVMEQKLGSWSESHGQEEVEKSLIGFHGAGGTQLELLADGSHIGRLGAPDTSNAIGTDAKAQGWNMGESFGYEGLGERP